MSGCPGGIEGCLCDVVDELRAQLEAALKERDRYAARCSGQAEEVAASSWMENFLANAIAERDRMLAALALTPENITAVEAVIVNIEGIEPWDDVAEAVIIAIRAKAGLK